MQIGNTYTYRQSELLQLSDEIKAEIAEADFAINNLLAKIQGNYYALNSLHETLGNGTDSCELAVNSIRIVPDSWQEKSSISLLDLPLEQKEIVIAQIIAIQSLRAALSDATTFDEHTANAIVFASIVNDCKHLSEQQIDDTLRALIANQQEERATGEYTNKLRAIATKLQKVTEPN